MSSFMKIQIFSINQDTHSSISKSLSALFHNSYAREQICQPLLVYHRRSTVSPPPPDHSLNVDPTFQQKPAILPCSTPDPKPPEKYDYFKPLSLKVTLAYVLIPYSYKHVIEHKCWQELLKPNFYNWGKVKNQTCYIVLCPSSFNPLKVNFQ